MRAARPAVPVPPLTDAVAAAATAISAAVTPALPPERAAAAAATPTVVVEHVATGLGGGGARWEQWEAVRGPRRQRRTACTTRECGGGDGACSGVTKENGIEARLVPPPALRRSAAAVAGGWVRSIRGPPTAGEHRGSGAVGWRCGGSSGCACTPADGCGGSRGDCGCGGGARHRRARWWVRGLGVAGGLSAPEPGATRGVHSTGAAESVLWAT